MGSPRLGISGRLVPEQFCIRARLILILEITYGLSSLTLISTPPAVPFSAGPTLATTVSLVRSRLRCSTPGFLQMELIECSVKACECQANQLFDGAQSGNFGRID